MNDVFLAGPIDFQDISDLADYRLRMKRAVENAGFSAIDQYSEALDIITDSDGVINIEEVAKNIHRLPDEPYLEAVHEASMATSMNQVLADPSIIPEYTSENVIDSIVERDLELLSESDLLLAYLPQPSCGTAIEIFWAHKYNIPSVVISTSPPHFVQYFTNHICRGLNESIRILEEIQLED
ncbi:hypothetical protein [Natrialba aegyptia]|uniref:hypothetical protein n=1 Tax=Natrialba aegyptia TaxID=129789 RepID=UPI001267C5EF|nr:hypothetical protein [Natrialba aegyptia]